MLLFGLALVPHAQANHTFWSTTLPAAGLEIVEGDPPTSFTIHGIIAVATGAMTDGVPPRVDFLIPGGTPSPGGTPYSYYKNADIQVSPASFEFFPSTYGQDQNYQITALEDGVVIDPVNPSVSTIITQSTPDYGSQSHTYQILVYDNDRGTVIFVPTGTGTDVTEGGTTDTYQVRLPFKPASSADPTVGTVTVTMSSPQVTTTPATLTFSQANWNVAQTVTVTAIDDAVAETSPLLSSILHSMSSNDPKYDGASRSLAVSVTDNDVAGVIVAETGGGTAVAEGSAATDTYTVKLNSQPTAAVMVTVTADAQVTRAPATLTFTAATWSSPQTITVGAVDDAVTEANPHPGVTSHSASSADPFYNGISVVPVTASVADNDGAAPPAPSAIGDAYTVAQETAFVSGLCATPPATVGGPYSDVLCNDQDTANHALQAVLVAASGPTHAAAFTLAAKGGIAYTGTIGYCGPDSFQYTLHDVTDNVDFNTVTVAITVTCAAGAPTAAADTYNLNEDCSASPALLCATPFAATALPGCAAPGGVLCNDPNPPGHTLQSTLVSGPSQGSLTTPLSSSGAFAYRPNAGFCGTDSFVYQLYDATALAAVNTATATLNVACVNDTPQPSGDTYTIIKDTPLAALAPRVTINDVDAEAGGPASWSTFAVTSVTVPSAGGAAVIAGPDIKYKPLTGYVGPESFSYTVTDGGGASASATVSITVKVNQVPTARFTAAPSTSRIGEAVVFVDGSSDPDQGDAVAAWTWDFGDGYTSSARNPTHIFGVVGSPSVCLTARDGYGGRSLTTCRVQSVLAPTGQAQNPAPAQPPASQPTDPSTPPAFGVEAGNPLTALSGTPVSLQATGPGGASFEWIQSAGPHILLAGAGTAHPSFTAPDVRGDPVALYFEVTASLAEKTAIDGVMVMVHNGNILPVVQAIAPSGANVGETVTLDASRSSDADGDFLTFHWTQLAGPPVPVAASSESKVHVAVVEAGTYGFIVEVSDGLAAASSMVSFSVSAMPPVNHAAAVPATGFMLTVGPGGLVTAAPSISAPSYLWDFGDGAPVEMTTGPTTHAYAASGEYQVTMRTGDSLTGATYQHPATVSVSPARRGDGAPPAATDPTFLVGLVGAILGVAGLCAVGVTIRRRR
ncbi:MAG: Ig-like domain-containing protein [bacterium]